MILMDKNAFAEKILECLVIVFALVISCAVANAADRILLAPSFSSEDSRYRYPYSVLKRTLEVTVETDGPFEISYSHLTMNRNRALEAMTQGKLINVHVAATRPEWEDKTIPVRIPILKGLLGYRLLLVKEVNLRKFKAVKTIDDLRNLRAGAGQQWTTTLILKDAGFKIVTGIDYEGLFGMLIMERFDYFPRGVNEIFMELESRKKNYPEMLIEPSLSIYFTTPSYFFVSPQYPKLADRIKRGLELLIATGEFNKMFERQYRADIVRADLKNRKIFRIPNKFLSTATPLDRPELWFTP